MVAVPVATPVTMPVEPIVATAGEPELHTPLAPALSSVVLPTHKLLRPTMVPATGRAVTVSSVSVLQPVGSMYAIVVVPAARAVAVPLEAPMVATAGIPEVHAPPGVTSLNVVVPPGHICSEPLMPAGMGLTVTEAV